MDEEENGVIVVSTSEYAAKLSTNSSDKKKLDADRNQSKMITNLLKSTKDNYVVLKNTKNVSSDIWQKFGLPARRSSNNSNRFEVIPNYSSCFKCFQTYRFLDSTTSSMRDHKCPQEVSNAQTQFKSFISSPTTSSSFSRSAFTLKKGKEKKENIKKLLVQWVVTSMRPFQIVSDPGLQAIMQECLDIGSIISFHLIISNLFSFKVENYIWKIFK